MLTGLGLALATVLLAPTAVVDVVVARIASGFGSECAELAGVDVHSGSWPVVARAITGHLQDVTVDVEEVRLRTFAVHDVNFAVASADVAPLGGALVAHEADVRDGQATATLRFTEIERIVADHGVDMTVRRDGSGAVADVDVPLVGPVPTGITVAPADGQLEIRLAALDRVALPPLRITPAEPFRIEAVEVLDEGVQVGLTFDGRLAAGDSHCSSVDEEP